MLDHAHVPIPKVDRSADPTHHAQNNTIIVHNSYNILLLLYYTCLSLFTYCYKLLICSRYTCIMHAPTRIVRVQYYQIIFGSSYTMGDDGFTENAQMTCEKKTREGKLAEALRRPLSLYLRRRQRPFDFQIQYVYIYIYATEAACSQ